MILLLKKGGPQKGEHHGPTSWGRGRSPRLPHGPPVQEGGDEKRGAGATMKVAAGESRWPDECESRARSPDGLACDTVYGTPARKAGEATDGEP